MKAVFIDGMYGDNTEEIINDFDDTGTYLMRDLEKIFKSKSVFL